MKVKCPYCDYSYPDQPLSLDILRAMTEKDIPTEDMLMWTQRLVKQHNKQYGLSNYRGAMVHIGRKHKGREALPASEWNKEEKRAINGD